VAIRGRLAWLGTGDGVGHQEHTYLTPVVFPAAVFDFIGIADRHRAAVLGRELVRGTGGSWRSCS
jgi:hypothetical protein